MAGPTVNLTAVPTGGAVLIQLPDYFAPASGVTTMTLSRSVSASGGWSQFYSGALLPSFVDCGDGTPAPLVPTTAYYWQVTDNLGTTVSGPLTPSCTVTTVPDQLTDMLIRLMQGALNSLSLPPDLSAAQPLQVTTQMPQGGWEALPFIVVNLDLIQQTEVGIGEDVPNPTQDNDWSLWVNAKRVWRITHLTRNVDERDYYRDSLLSVFRVLAATPFSQLGLNVHHSFQAASYTDAHEWEGRTPGFYGCDIMLELDGCFPTAVLTNYGKITSIELTSTTSSQAGSGVVLIANTP